MATTSVYGLPYQEGNDSPNGPTLGKDLAEAVEVQLQRLDTPPIAVLRQTTAQPLDSGTFEPITFGAVEIDSHSGWNGATRYTIQVAGVYQVSGGVAFAAGTTGRRWCRLLRNGTEIPGSGANMNATSAGQALLTSRPTLVSCAVGDYIELAGFQDSGGPLDTYVAVTYAQSTLVIRWVHT